AECSTIDMLNILYVNVYQETISESIPANNGELIKLREFESRFCYITHWAGILIYYVVALLLIYYVYIHYNENSEVSKLYNKIDTISAVLGVLGVSGILADIFSRQKISKYVTMLLRKVLGHK
ncbi:MAG: hypothetical protein WA952_08385, partial [Lewinella sp.]